MVGQRDWSNSLYDWVLGKTLNYLRKGRRVASNGWTERNRGKPCTECLCVEDDGVHTERQWLVVVVPDKTRNCPY